MLHLLASNTFLLIFLVITMGAILGGIPIAGIRFGSAGTLFVGLAVGAVVQHPTGDLKALQSLGLFAYLVGLESGEEFFRELKQQFGVIAASVVALTIGAVTAVMAGLLLNTPGELTVGIFTGALTSTPGLAPRTPSRRRRPTWKWWRSGWSTHAARRAARRSRRPRWWTPCASTVWSLTGLTSALVAGVVTLAGLGSFYLMMRLLGRSLPRTSGGAAALLGQPAVLQFATSRMTDSRVMNGYSTVITVGMIAKIVMVPLVLSVA